MYGSDFSWVAWFFSRNSSRLSRFTIIDFTITHLLVDHSVSDVSVILCQSSLWKITACPLKSRPPVQQSYKPAVSVGWLIETQTTDQTKAPAQQFLCLCTGLMRDLLTFPITAVNFCLSVHFQDWLSVWSEQLQAKCVCQLRQSPLAFCCPKKRSKEKTPPLHSPCDTPPHTETPQTSPCSQYPSSQPLHFLLAMTVQLESQP